MSDANSDSWCTPKWLAELLGSFDLDPCSNEQSHVDARWNFQLEEVSPIAPSSRVRMDGLKHGWGGSVFVNPPYSEPQPWCKRLAAHDAPWCALLKLDPSTRWWATLMDVGAQFAPFRKRIKFERPGMTGMTANFPSVLVWNRWQPSRDLAAHLWIASYSRAA